MNKKLLVILKYDNLKHHIFRNVSSACVHLHGEIIGFKLNFKMQKGDNVTSFFIHLKKKVEPLVVPT